MRMAHTTFQVSDMDRYIDFYVGKLGLTEHFRLYNADGSLWIVYLRCEDGRFIELFTTEDAPHYDKHGTFQHVCFEVDDLSACGNEMIEKGLDIYLGPTHLGKKASYPYKAEFVGKCGSRAFYVADPDGNEVEIMEYLPTSLQTKTVEEIEKLRPLIESNDYIPEARAQGGKMSKKELEQFIP